MYMRFWHVALEFEKQKTLQVQKRTVLWNTVQLCSSNIVFSFTCCICTRVFV